MRTIDADVLMEVLEKIPAMGFKNIDNQTYTLVLLAQVFNIIEQQPTIEERKKGKWINHRNDMGHNIADCSECGEAMQWYDPDTRPNYCPNCGSYNGGENEV